MVVRWSDRSVYWWTMQLDGFWGPWTGCLDQLEIQLDKISGRLSRL